MPRVGFEPMVPVFEREKTVHALDRAATMIGQLYPTLRLNNIASPLKNSFEGFIYVGHFTMISAPTVHNFG
jgi:hypothetical protein